MRRDRVRGFLAGAIVVGAVALASSASTFAAFSSTTTNDGNGVGNDFSAGTVYLTDNDGGSLMFNASGMRPSDAARTSCISVTYNGTLNADVRLYGNASSSGVEPYLNLTVETGTSTTGFDDCSGFSAAQTLYTGTLSGYPADFASGIVDPGNPWTTGETHAYRFTVSLQNVAAAQGKTATATFRWEARDA